MGDDRIGSDTPPSGVRRPGVKVWGMAHQRHVEPVVPRRASRACRGPNTSKWANSGPSSRVLVTEGLPDCVESLQGLLLLLLLLLDSIEYSRVQ